MAMSERIFVYGASGHGKVVLDAARQQGHEILAVFDDDPLLAGTNFMGYPVPGGREVLPAWCRQQGCTAGIVAIGNNRIRAEVARWLGEVGIRLVAVIHPRATVAPGVLVGAGSVLMAGAVINVDTRLGANCIINTGACIDHDCDLGDTVHVAPGCHLCGNVRIGRGTLIGAGSTVIPGIRIGERAIIGAGSTVIHDVISLMKMAGSPCRELK